MKTIKTDQRSKYTQMIVKKTLLKLLSSGQSLNKITVAELCAAADINRGTFYNHFYDVFDVYERIEKDFFDELKEELDKIKTSDLNNSFFKKALLLIYKNIDISMLILNGKTYNAFFDNLLTYVKNKFISEWSDIYKTIPKNVVEYIFTYVTNGCLGIITTWMKNGMKESLDDISDLVEKFNKLIFQW